MLCKVLVLDSLGQFKMGSNGLTGTRKVHVPGKREPNIQGTRTVPGTKHTRYKNKNDSGTQVL